MAVSEKQALSGNGNRHDHGSRQKLKDTSKRRPVKYTVIKVH